MTIKREQYKQFAGAMALLLGSLAPTLAVGENEIESYYLNQPLKQKAAQNFKLDHSDKPYESLKFSDDFRIKGWEVGEGIYFGKAKIAGENGPGLIFEQEGYSWGFNHRGVALHIPL
jgi:hypothetical protein